MERLSILYDLNDTKNDDGIEIKNENNYDFQNIIDDLNLREISKRTQLSPEDINYVLRIMTDFKTTKKDIKLRYDVIDDFLRLEGFYDIFMKQMLHFKEIREKLTAAKRNMIRTNADVSAGNSNAFLNYNRITLGCTFFTLTYRTIFNLYKDLRDMDIQSPHLLKFSEFLIDLIENSSFKRLNEECQIFNDHVNEGVVFDIDMKLNSILRIISLRMYDFRYVKPIQTGGLIWQLTYSVMKALSIEEKQNRNKYIYIEKTFTQTSKISNVDDAYLKSSIEYQINLVARRLAAIYETLIDLFMNISGELVFYNYALRMINYMRKTGVPYCFAELDDDNDGQNNIIFSDLCDIALSGHLKDSESGQNVVKNDYILNDKDGINIIIGGNQSGKTTFLRAFGTSLMFARAGLPIPAKSAKITMFKNLYTHFQRYDAEIKNEGQLDTELTEMEKIVYSIDKDSILLMNESFSSTGIKDATQIAVDVLSALSYLGAKSVYVTHIQNLSEKLSSSENLSKKVNINLYKTGQNNDGTYTYKLEKLTPNGL